MPQFIDLTGQRFGMIVVQSLVSKATRAEPYTKWRYVCDCGNSGIAQTNNLRSGRSQSCGCRFTSYKHGHAARSGTSRLYRIWNNMKERCTKPQCKDWKNYGGRGIRIEFSDFPTFAKWAQTNGYADDLTIERKDNDGPYSSANCTWIPKGKQVANRR